MTIEQTFTEAWLEAIYRKDNYFSFRQIATSHQLDPEDLRQEVAQWFTYESGSIEEKCAQADVSENYLVRIINNQAKKLASQMQAQRWDETGQYTYEREFIRKHKYELAEAFGRYTLASEAHAVYVDFDKAFSSLTAAQQADFLTPPADYPGETGSKEYQRFSAKVGRLTTRVHRIMNNEAWNDGRVIDHG
ncbi:hypothetical protein [Amycolatopsis sp. lyj-112]|uniref:hypothetical protein n=1 Tax=Amycolatopsis sp. lyj-112 TaxID=2789288 RepID=UPI00397A986B